MTGKQALSVPSSLSLSPSFSSFSSSSSSSSFLSDSFVSVFLRLRSISPEKQHWQRSIFPYTIDSSSPLSLSSSSPSSSSSFCSFPGSHEEAAEEEEEEERVAGKDRRGRTSFGRNNQRSLVRVISPLKRPKTYEGGNTISSRDISSLSSSSSSVEKAGFGREDERKKKKEANKMNTVKTSLPRSTLEKENERTKERSIKGGRRTWEEKRKEEKSKAVEEEKRMKKKKENEEQLIKMEREKGTKKKCRFYEVDQVFDESTSQEDIFKIAGIPAVHTLLQGVTACILA